MSGRKSSKAAPAIRAAFTRQLPERGAERQKKSEPMTDEQLLAWSEEQAEKFGVRAQAKRAAAAGRGLMVFIQAENRSVPYEQYLKFLEAGGHPVSNTEPLEEIIQAENSMKEEEESRVKAMELYGLHGEALDDFIARSSEAQAA